MHVSESVQYFQHGTVTAQGDDLLHDIAVHVGPDLDLNKGPGRFQYLMFEYDVCFNRGLPDKLLQSAIGVKAPPPAGYVVQRWCIGPELEEKVFVLAFQNIFNNPPAGKQNGGADYE